MTGKDLGTTAPTLPGSYTASITVEGQTVIRGFKITKATPTIRSWQGYPYGKTFDGTQLANPASDRLTISGGTYSDIAGNSIQRNGSRSGKQYASFFCFPNLYSGFESGTDEE